MGLPTSTCWRGLSLSGFVDNSPNWGRQTCALSDPLSSQDSETRRRARWAMSLSVAFHEPPSTMESARQRASKSSPFALIFLGALVAGIAYQ